jgi:protein-tyrosine phosphatase/membrane-associated phospholipid phosphatase
VNRPDKLAAAKTSAGLSLLFLVVYGSCNWITAHRHDVGTWYYAWERFIPFVPILIVPYMSIDLLYVAAPFLCQSRVELRTFARRIAFAILASGACFLLFPLKTGTLHPQPSGWMGTIFGFLRGFDQPYNLFPSLHITLRTILAVLYARHTRGIVRVASNMWFSLIGFSTLLTYQHHFVDIVGGFVLATSCFYLFREEKAALRVIPNWRIGAYYAIGAILAVALAFLYLPWTAIMLWPAFSLAVAAGAYWGLSPVIFRKTDGCLPFSTCLLLWPNLAGQYLSLRHYLRQSDAWNQVTERVWIGAHLGEKQALQCVRAGVTAVLDLTAEFSEARAFRDVAYCNIPVLDLTQMSNEQLGKATEFIARHSDDGIVYVHCKIGYSRSAAAIGAWLLSSGRAVSVEQALRILKLARPGIVFRPEVTKALKYFEQELRDVPLEV